MAKAKAGAKKAKPAAKKTIDKPSLLKTAKKAVAAMAKLTKAAAKEKAPAKEKSAKALPPPEKAPAKAGKAGKGHKAPAPEKPRPRATELPAVQEALNTREIEQVLTVGMGRGVAGEGSLKGRLVVKDNLPYLHVIGRDKRELVFLLQGPDQEVFPAYVDHKVSVTGLIRKMSNTGGTVDVRKYSARKPETDVVEPGPVEEKLKFLSPGEVQQVCSAGMGAGVRGFASLRGSLEMTGDDFFLVVSNGGTRQQVSFNLQGKGAKGLKKLVGNWVQVTGVVEKSSGWGGKIDVENVEPRPAENRAIIRDHLDVVRVDDPELPAAVEVKMNQGLSVRLPERPGYIWAIEPTVAKRCSLREANFETTGNGQATREFFFTPRNPGVVEIEFFLAKAFSPAQVSKSTKLTVNVKPT